MQMIATASKDELRQAVEAYPRDEFEDAARQLAAEVAALAEQTQNPCKVGSAAGRHPVRNDMIRKNQS
jgi:hypothetical protein